MQSGQIAFHRTLVAAMGLSNHHPARRGHVAHDRDREALKKDGVGRRPGGSVVSQFEMVASMSGRLCRILHLREFRVITTGAESARGIRKRETGFATRATPDRRRFRVIDALEQLFLYCSPFSRSDAPRA